MTQAALEAARGELAALRGQTNKTMQARGATKRYGHEKQFKTCN